MNKTVMLIDGRVFRSSAIVRGDSLSILSKKLSIDSSYSASTIWEHSSSSGRVMNKSIVWIDSWIYWLFAVVRGRCLRSLVLSLSKFDLFIELSCMVKTISMPKEGKDSQ